MKRLLTGIYLYMGVFFAACYVSWLITGNEPAALIAGVSAAVGVESIAAGVIRIHENKEQNKHEKEMQYGTEHYGTGYGWHGGKQDQLEAETEFPEVPDDDRTDGDSSGGDTV
jgi:hypothetical protein